MTFFVTKIAYLYLKVQHLTWGLTVGEVQDATGVAALNPFSLEFSVAATLSFVDFLHAQQVVLIG